MTPLEAPLRVEFVKVADLRVQQLGVSPGIRGRFTLMAADGNVLAFVINHKYSERTYALLNELQESMEADVATILAKPSGGRDLEYEDPGDDEGGLSFG